MMIEPLYFTLKGWNIGYEEEVKGNEFVVLRKFSGQVEPVLRPFELF